MTETVVIVQTSWGKLALELSRLREAVDRANKMVGADSEPSEAALTPPASENAVQWLSVGQVAARTNLKPSWLYAEIRANRLPFRQFGRQVRIPSSYLAEPDTESGEKSHGGL